MLTVGQKAPEFELENQDGKKVGLADVAGKFTLIYFYPKDDTPGCTKEACTIAEVYDEFETMGISVVGISKDSPASHKKFKEKYHLPFTLLSDAQGNVIDAYGAWQNKSMFGRSFMGIARVSYLLDKNGVVVRVYESVDPATHALDILRDVRAVL